MSSLRLLGILSSVLLYVLIFILSKRKKINRGTFFLIFLFVVFLALVSINPGIVNILPYLLDIKKGENYRLITLLIASSLFSWFFIFYLLGKITRTKDKLYDFFDKFAIMDFENSYGKNFKFADIVVVIPAYNEEKSIKNVLSGIPNKIDNIDIDVLVVVDGGEDDTYNIVKSLNFPAVRTIVNRGGGMALRLGYKLALKLGARIIVTMDADGQHDPAQIANIVSPIVNSEADLVIGSRIIGKAHNTPFLRKTGIYFFSWIMSMLTLTRLTDCSNGFRAMKSDGLGKLMLKEEQYYSPELLIEAARSGLVIKEVPVTVHERTHGVSKKGRDIMYGVKFGRTILKAVLRSKNR